MNNRERSVLISILLGIVVIVVADLVTDSQEGVKWGHLFFEGAAAVSAAVGLFFLIRSSFVLKHSLDDERQNSSLLHAEAQKWHAQSKKYLEGLSHAIDAQLIAWNLTPSEKEVTFLLLKGLSLKEVAEARQTTEKTARAQSIAIYAKSGLGGRSQLSAFFLEDLLVPQGNGGEPHMCAR